MPLYKTVNGWRYEFQLNGVRYTKSGFKTKREATTHREKERKRIKKELKEAPADTAFKEIANQYLDYAQRKFVEKTYKQKAFVYKSFLKYTGNLEISVITSHHLHQYLNTRPSNNNYNAHRKDLCALFSFARKSLKTITYNPCWDLDKMPHTPEQKYIPPETDILKLIAVADPETDEKDLLLTILNTGARVDEILRLKWQDINLEKRTMTRWTKKRRGGAYEAIICHMNKDLYHIMSSRWKARKNEMWVFYNEKTEDRFNKRPKFMGGLCKRARVSPAFGFHSLRHFVASYLADREKISKKTIGSLLGHKSLQTTEIYLHSVDDSDVQALNSLTGVFTGTK